MNISDRKQKLRFLFTEAPMFKTIMYISIPAVIGMVILGFYNFTDRLLAAHLVADPTSTLKAMALASPVFLFMNAVGALFSLGGATRFGVAIGANKPGLARKIVGNTMAISFFVGIAMTIFMWYFQSTFTKWQSTQVLSAETIAKATAYNRYVIIGFVPLLFSWIFAGFLRQEGHSTSAAVISFAPAFLNVLLDYLFMGPLKMGLEGAAIATTIDQTFQALLGLSLVLFVFKDSLLRISFYDLRFNFKILWLIFVIGLTPFARYFGLSISRTFTNNFVSKLHFANGVSAGQYWIYILGGVMPIVYFLFPPAFGFAQGGRAVISYNYGAKNYKRVIEAFYYTLAAMVIYLLLVTILLESIPRELLKIWKFRENGIQIYNKSAFLNALRHIDINLFNKYQHIDNNQIVTWNGGSILAHLPGTVEIHPLKDGALGTRVGWITLATIGVYYSVLSLYQGCGISKWAFAISLIRVAINVPITYLGIVISEAMNHNVIYYWIFQGTVSNIIVAIVSAFLGYYLVKHFNKNFKLLKEANQEEKTLEAIKE